MFNENDVIAMAKTILLSQKFENRRLLNCCKGVIWLFSGSGGDDAQKAAADEEATAGLIVDDDAAVETGIFVCCDFKDFHVCTAIENELQTFGNRLMKVSHSRMYEPSLEEIFACIKASDCLLIGI